VTCVPTPLREGRQVLQAADAARKSPGKVPEHSSPCMRQVCMALGRRRRFDGERGAKEIRQAKATILQQSEAEVLRMALMTLVDTFRRKKMKSRVVMIRHDAIWAEVLEEEAEEAKRLLQQSMAGAVEFPFVPLEVDFQ
jgi:DNA polymerase I-like protein with 3'-5' exonuclease and polymerase domains